MKILFSLFQYAEILFSKKRKYGDVTIYAGNDPDSRSEVFLSKCAGALGFLKENDRQQYNLFVEHIGRILGSGSVSSFYSFPRIIEVNHSEVINASPLSIASLIVGYTAFAQYQKTLNTSQHTIDEIYQLCLQEEARFQQKATGVPLSELEILKLKQKRFMPWSLKKPLLMKARNEALKKLKKS